LIRSAAIESCQGTISAISGSTRLEAIVLTLAQVLTLGEPARFARSRVSNNVDRVENARPCLELPP
jgi:hypothetical protein